MFRNDKAMYTADAQAQVAVLKGLEAGFDKKLRGAERVFFYMPLMHAEELRLQERCVELFQELCDETPKERRKGIELNLKFAKDHRNIVARFGRFPHRNEILARETSAEEANFLKEPGSSF